MDKPGLCPEAEESSGDPGNKPTRYAVSLCAQGTSNRACSSVVERELPQPRPGLAGFAGPIRHVLVLACLHCRAARGIASFLQQEVPQSLCILEVMMDDADEPALLPDLLEEIAGGASNRVQMFPFCPDREGFLLQ